MRIQQWSYGLLSTLTFLVWPVSSLADPSLGDISNDIQHPIGTLTMSALKLTYVLGACLLLTAGMRYSQYRNNSNQVRFGDVVFCTLLGSGLILLALFLQFKYLPTLQ